MALDEVARQAGVDTACIKIIAKWESCLVKIKGQDLYRPYRCPANVPTVGIGTTVWPDGRRVSMNDPPIPYARCEEVLAYDIGKRYAPAVDRAFSKWQHENQRSACVSFAYNVGTAGFSKSTLCWLLKQGQYERAADEFLRWTRGGGRVLPGLVNRRRDERKLFLTSGGKLQVPDVDDTPSAQTAQSLPSAPQPVGSKSWWRRWLPW